MNGATAAEHAPHNSGANAPQVLILSAPSGAGKTSLARELVARRADVALTISHTTRRRRPGEVHGADYFFVDKREFDAMIAADAFIEYARVFGNYYGTSADAIEKLLTAGKHAVLEIDWQGARAVRRKFPHAVSVFIMPPSVEALEVRLKSRRQDDDAVIAARMMAARDEMAHCDEYDRVIVNDDFARAFCELEGVLPPLDKGGWGVYSGTTRFNNEARH